MATDAFLSCLSRQALERSATTEAVKVEVRVKDTRAALVKHCTGKTWHFPGALFPLTDEERADAARRTQWVSGAGRTSPHGDDPGEGDNSPEGGDEDLGEPDLDGPDGDDSEQQPYPAAAE
jgi:ParB family chromosome partitioning protein